MLKSINHFNSVYIFPISDTKNSSNVTEKQLMIQRCLFSCHKEIYKCKLVNSASRDPLCLYSPCQNFIHLRGLYESLSETLG